MKSPLLNPIFGLCLLAALAVPVCVVAQGEHQEAAGHVEHYTVTDLGTLEGGTFSQPFFINRYGLVSGSSNLADGTQHAVLWLGELKLDIGAAGLGGPNSIAFGDNERFQSSGEAEISTPDPNGEDFCGFGTHLTCLPFRWQYGVMTPLPTLGGNNGEAGLLNNRGEVAGTAENATPDSTCPAGGPQVLQEKPVIWRNGEIQALDTFRGDPDGWAFGINDSGQVVGASGICSTLNSDTFFYVLSRHALLWGNGKVTDLGNLGGTGTYGPGNIAYDINNQGQVVGTSDLKGDTTFHGFLWTMEKGIQDLGTLSGDVASLSVSINDAGSVVGESVDASGNLRAFLWEKGKMHDLNTLIAGDSPLYLLAGCSINSRGEITGLGLTSAGEFHTYLATPTHGVATGESTSQGVISSRVLGDDARKLLQQHLRSGRLGARSMGLQ